MEILTQYLTERQVSNLTNIALSTLRNHRFQCRGLPYIKIGKSIRYSLQDVVEYLERFKIIPKDI